MSELFIMRHGQAEDPSAATGWSDRARRLTDVGVQRIQAMIPAMKGLEFVPDVIVSSPYPRAAETARIVHEGLKIDAPIQLADELGADRSVLPFFKIQLEGYLESSDRLMVVGHEPILSQLASLLISGHINTRIQMKKGAVIHLHCGVFGKECRGVLRGMWTPKQLRQVSNA